MASNIDIKSVEAKIVALSKIIKTTRSKAVKRDAILSRAAFKSHVTRYYKQVKAKPALKFEKIPAAKPVVVQKGFKQVVPVVLVKKAAKPNAQVYQDTAFTPRLANQTKFWVEIEVKEI